MASSLGFTEQNSVDVNKMASSLGVTLSHIARYTHIPAQSLTGNNKLTRKVHTRLLDVQSIMSRVRNWFDTDLQAWAWFTGQPLASLGNLTASEVIHLYDDKGVEAVQDFITAKELGGYE